MWFIHVCNLPFKCILMLFAVPKNLHHPISSSYIFESVMSVPSNNISNPSSESDCISFQVLRYTPFRYDYCYHITHHFIVLVYPFPRLIPCAILDDDVDCICTKYMI